MILSATAFLPENQIVEAIKNVEVWFASVENFKQIMNYFKRVWLVKYHPSLWSQCGQIRRTNNDCESFHSSLTKRFGCTKPTFWRFVLVVSKIIKETNVDVEKMKKGFYKKGCSKAARENDVLLKLTENYLEEELSQFNFLKLVANCFHEENFDENEMEQLLGDGDGNGSDDELIQGLERKEDEINNDLEKESEEDEKAIDEEDYDEDIVNAVEVVSGEDGDIKEYQSKGSDQSDCEEKDVLKHTLPLQECYERKGKRKYKNRTDLKKIWALMRKYR